LEIINLLLPLSYEGLIEPFVGGGAVFLNLKPQRTIINDTNRELIITYQVVKDKPRELLKLCSKYEKKHSKDFYEELRKQEAKNLNDLEIATRFVYLNKTGFNGLYRVNSQGIFNVPFGKKDKIKLVDKNNILAISEYLNSNNCQILNQDYRELLHLVKEGDFLFVDPPYDNDNTNGFTEYTANGFNKENQRELLQFLKEVEKKGVKWLLTNHATSFIQELYQKYPQFVKKAYRYINCQGDKRVGSAREIFV
jgi:DNA adenine methylase